MYLPGHCRHGTRVQTLQNLKAQRKQIGTMATERIRGDIRCLIVMCLTLSYSHAHHLWVSAFSACFSVVFPRVGPKNGASSASNTRPKMIWLTFLLDLRIDFHDSPERVFLRVLLTLTFQRPPPRMRRPPPLDPFCQMKKWIWGLLCGQPQYHIVSYPVNYSDIPVNLDNIPVFHHNPAVCGKFLQQTLHNS